MASRNVKIDLQTLSDNISRLNRVILSKLYDNIINEVSHSEMFILWEDICNRERIGIEEKFDHWFPRPDGLLHYFWDLDVHEKSGNDREIVPQNPRLVTCSKSGPVSMHYFSQRICQRICKVEYVELLFRSEQLSDTSSISELELKNICQHIKFN
jgi:hypothetical protein